MKIIQVGVGKMGQHWLDVLSSSAEVELAGIVEPVEALRERAIAKVGLAPERAFASLDEAITGLEFDAAAVVTPPATHRPISEQLLRAGKHVVQEKPLAATMEDARALGEVAAETGKTLMVAQNYRHFEAYRTVKQVIESGRVGRIVSVAIRFDKDTRTLFGEGDFRYAMEYPLLIDMSIHHFDMLRGLLGTDATRVYAQTWHVPDGNYAHDAAATVQFTMSDGVPVTYVGNWAAYGAETSWNGAWEIVGDQGVLRWAGGDWDAAEISFQPHGGEVEQVPLVPKGPTGQESLVAAFVEAVRQGTEPPTSAADNIRSLAMVFGAVESASTGVVVNLGNHEPVP